MTVRRYTVLLSRPATGGKYDLLATHLCLNCLERYSEILSNEPQGIYETVSEIILLVAVSKRFDELRTDVKVVTLYNVCHTLSTN